MEKKVKLLLEGYFLFLWSAVFSNYVEKTFQENAVSWEEGIKSYEMIVN